MTQRYIKIDNTNYLVEPNNFESKNTKLEKKLNVIKNIFISNHTYDILDLGEFNHYILEPGKLINYNHLEIKIIKEYQVIPICSVAGKFREIDNQIVYSLLWTWNNNSFGININPELKQKIELIKINIESNIKFNSSGLVFSNKHFENPLAIAIQQATVYTSWFKQILGANHIFCNLNSGGEIIELSKEEQEYYGMSHIIRPYQFMVVFN